MIKLSQLKLLFRPNLSVFIFSNCFFYIFNSYLAGAQVFSAFKFLAFYILWILAPGCVFSCLIGQAGRLLVVLAPLLGITFCLFFYLLGVAVQSVPSVMIFGVVLFWAFVFRFFLKSKKYCLKTDQSEFDVSFKILVPFVIFWILTILYRRFVFDIDFSLPGLVSSPSYFGIDYAWFMGNVHAVAKSFFPMDFRISGASLSYHFLYFQLIAAYTKIFKSGLIEALTVLAPMAILHNLVLSVVLFLHQTGRGIASPIISVGLCFFSSYLGFSSASAANMNMAANLFNSPTIPFGLMLMLSAIVFFSSAFCSRLMKKGSDHLVLGATFFLVFFILTGSKISISAIAFSGWIVHAFYKFYLDRRYFEWSSFLGMLLGFFVGFLYYFFDKSGVARPTAIQFPGPMFRALSETFPIDFVRILAGQSAELSITKLLWGIFGFLWRYFPLLLTLLLGCKKSKFTTTDQLLVFMGLSGVFSGLILGQKNDPFHFFHPGIFCFGLVAASRIGRVWDKLFAHAKVILFLLVFVSVLPHGGDLKASRSNFPKPSVDVQDLDVHLFNAYQFIRRTTKPDAIVLTGNPLLVHPYWKSMPFNFYASAFTERQCYLDGWGFSSYADVTYENPGKLTNQIRLMRGFYRSANAEIAKSIQSQMRATVIVWDQRKHGKTPKWIKSIAIEVYRSGLVAVYFTKTN